jgi:DNA-binding transcriptional LysR family regulator
LPRWNNTLVACCCNARRARRLHVLPRLPRFLERHPGLTVDLVLSDGFTDLVEEGIDLAIRVGELNEQGLVARRIAVTRRVVVATPGYLERRGVPETPEALRQHDCVVYSRLASGPVWHFEGAISVPISGRVRVSTTEAVRAAILGGLGIGMVPAWHFVDREIEEGRLVRLLQAWEPQPQPVHAVYPTRRFLAPKVRAMIDFLAAEFELEPLLSGYR